MVDLLASDGVFLTFIVSSIASAMLNAPLFAHSIEGADKISAPNRRTVALRILQRLVAPGVICRDNAP
jgi:hypothetical protein